MSIKYKWLASTLKESIASCLEQGKDKLPTEKQLCEQYKVSRQTVREALAILEKEGLILRKQGSGAYLTGTLPGGNNEIVLLISSEHEYIYPEVISGIRQTLQDNHYTLKIYETNNSVAIEHDILQKLLQNRPRGILVEGCKSALPNPNVSLYRQLEQEQIPVLFLFNRYQNYTESISLTDENENGSALLVRFLLEKGHTSIGGIFKSDDYQGLYRYYGYMNTLFQNHIIVKDDQVCFYRSEDLEGLRTKQDTVFLQKMYPALKDCSAVICYNDEIAYWFQYVLQTHYPQLAKDMTITAFDNTYLTSQLTSSITTLSHHFDEIGSAAAIMLMDRIKGKLVISSQIPWFLT